MQYGFVKTAALTPSIRVADCAYNARQIIEVLRGAAAAGAEIACLPELCITGYTCGDLFFQLVLQQGARDALADVLRDTAGLSLLFVLGLPLTHGGKLYNCAAVCQNGRVLGVVPKTHLPNYNEFYESGSLHLPRQKTASLTCRAHRSLSARTCCSNAERSPR